MSQSRNWILVASLVTVVLLAATWSARASAGDHVVDMRDLDARLRVSQADGVPSVASSYTALPAAAAGRDVRLAFWRSGMSNSGLTTAVAVMNVGDASADVVLELADLAGVPLDGCGSACVVALEPHGVHYWWMPELPGIEHGGADAVGTARVTSDQPLVASVLDVAMAAYAADHVDMAAFSGASANVPPNLRLPLPLLLAIRSDDLDSVHTRRTIGKTSGISGAGATGIHVMNLDSLNRAQLAAEFYPQSGSAPLQFPATIDPGGWYAMYLPAMGLPNGAYAGLLYADRTLAALAWTDWLQSGGRAAYSGAATGVALRVPIATMGFGEMCSLVTIQNTRVVAAATAVVDFFTADGVAALRREYPISPGASITLRLCDEDDFIANLPIGYAGTMLITAKDGETELAAQAFIDVARSDRAVYAFEALPVELAAIDVLAPLVHAAFGLPSADPLYIIDSRIAVANEDDIAVDVEVTYRGMRGSCVGNSVTQGPVTLGPNALVVLQPSDVLPPDCASGAVITASGPIHAVVLDDGLDLTLGSPTRTPLPTATPSPTATPTPITPLPPAEGYDFETSDMNPTPGAGSNVTGMAELGSHLVFNADDGSGPRSALWSTDGSVAGVRLVSRAAQVGGIWEETEVEIGEPEFTPLDTRLLYRGYTDEYGSEFWATDGTEAGTRMVRDIRSGEGSSNPSGLIRFRDAVFFAADDGVHGPELWRSDGTEAGTSMVKDIAPPEVDQCVCSMVVFEDRLYFTADDGVYGQELWVTDGTSEGTEMVADLMPGAEHSVPNKPTALGELLMFLAFDEGGTRALWVTDGTASGTERIYRFRGADDRVDNPLLPWRDRLYFSAADGRGLELWSTDGTENGTQLVADIAPGRISSIPEILGVIGDRILLAADDNEHGREPWTSDGTKSGTNLLADFAPGPGDSSIGRCMPAGSKLLCSAADGTYGREPVVVEPNGTMHALGDLRPGHFSSDAAWLMSWRGTAHLTADDGIHGNELWTVALPRYSVFLPVVSGG